MELLVVVVLLTIVAAVVVPALYAPGKDAKLSTLKADLARLRQIVEVYRVEHGGRYPGQYREIDGTTKANTRSEAEDAIRAQLTMYSDVNGRVSPTPSAVFSFGPYLRTLPVNPFQTGPLAGDVTADVNILNITTPPSSSGQRGWKFYVKTGRVIADDGTTLSDGTRTVDL